MARKPRAASSCDTYHVIQRGVGLFDIFEDDDDREAYLSQLRESARLYGCKIISWCLMSNHVHLVVQAPLASLSSMMHQLGSKYARRFNRRHGRIGHLFQGRFTSVPVESDAQLLQLVRYVHRNPVRHEVDALIGSYRWSSYAQYENGEKGLASTSLILEMLGSTQEFTRFTSIEGEEKFADVDAERSISDDKARKMANDALSASDIPIAVSRIGTLIKAKRDAALALVARLGLSLRQIQRLTGVNYNAVRTAAIAAGVYVPKRFV